VGTGGLAGLGVKSIAAKVLVVTAVAGSAGTGGYVAVEQIQKDGGAPPARAEQAVAPARATPVALDTRAPAIRTPVAITTGAAAKPASPAAKPKPKRARGRALGTKASHGKAAAPGQLKAPRTPAQGKALGHTKPKAQRVKPSTPKRAHKSVKAHKPKHSASKRPPKAPPASSGTTDSRDKSDAGAAGKGEP
jgi:hypothetical protein